ncbi:MAG: DUF1016 N-terminal domain-containing protein [Candidatus Methanoperedens sp.]|nr:DUF1016 N-terminal domain-containing protein [Candidatus Methanoperedens sp.]
MTDRIPKDYTVLLNDIKQRIRSAQYEALKAVNRELISLYWDIGRMIIERQKGESWGKSVVERLARDLQAEFAGVGGFSASNLWRIKLFHETYAHNPKLAPMVREIGWFRTRITRIGRIFTDPCASVSSAQSVFHCIPSAFICVHLRLAESNITPQSTQRAQSMAAIIFASFALFAVRFIISLNELSSIAQPSAFIGVHLRSIYRMAPGEG